MIDGRCRAQFEVESRRVERRVPGLLRSMFVLLPTLVGTLSTTKPLKLPRASVLNALDAKTTRVSVPAAECACTSYDFYTSESPNFSGTYTVNGQTRSGQPVYTYWGRHPLPFLFFQGLAWEIYDDFYDDTSGDVCGTCSRQLHRHTGSAAVCPICRGPVRNSVRIYD